MTSEERRTRILGIISWAGPLVVMALFLIIGIAFPFSAFKTFAATRKAMGIYKLITSSILYGSFIACFIISIIAFKRSHKLHFGRFVHHALVGIILNIGLLIIPVIYCGVIILWETIITPS